MAPLSNFDLNPLAGPTTASYAASRDCPADDPYLSRVWRHAFLLAIAGRGQFEYRTQQHSSSLWGVGDTTARVYDAGYIDVIDETGTSHSITSITINKIDGKPYSEWVVRYL